MTKDPHLSSPRGIRASFVRLRALIRKEFCQIVRDPSSIAIALRNLGSYGERLYQPEVVRRLKWNA